MLNCYLCYLVVYTVFLTLVNILYVEYIIVQHSCFVFSENIGQMFKSSKSAIRTTAQSLSNAYGDFIKNSVNKTSGKRMQNLPIDDFIDSDDIIHSSLPPGSLRYDR
jgi:hypothetical protein